MSALFVERKPGDKQKELYNELLEAIKMLAARCHFDSTDRTTLKAIVRSVRILQDRENKTELLECLDKEISNLPTFDDIKDEEIYFDDMKYSSKEGNTLNKRIDTLVALDINKGKDIIEINKKLNNMVGTTIPQLLQYIQTNSKRLDALFKLYECVKEDEKKRIDCLDRLNTENLIRKADILTLHTAHDELYVSLHKEIKDNANIKLSIIGNNDEFKNELNLVKSTNSSAIINMMSQIQSMKELIHTNNNHILMDFHQVDTEIADVQSQLNNLNEFKTKVQTK